MHAMNKRCHLHLSRSLVSSHLCTVNHLMKAGRARTQRRCNHCLIVSDVHFVRGDTKKTCFCKYKMMMNFKEGGSEATGSC